MAHPASIPVIDIAPFGTGLPGSDAVVEAVAAACRERELELPRLLCEPGRSLVAPAGVTLYELGSRKQIPGFSTYLAVDGGMSDNPRPITYQSSYTACLADRPGAAAVETVTLAGKHCESGDIVIHADYLPGDVAPDDLLAVPATGAYCFSLSSNYNYLARPPVVAVRDGIARVIVRGETEDDLLSRDAGIPAAKDNS